MSPITQWVGYKIHITETRENDLPHLVTKVETMTGPIADGAATPAIGNRPQMVA